MAHFVTRYDFRAPGADPATRRELFGRAVEQAAYLDAHGEDSLMLSEHHAADDGYLPSPIHSLHFLPDPGFSRAVAAFLDEERRHMAGLIAALDQHSPFRQTDATPETE